MRYNSFVFRLWQTEHEGDTSAVDIRGRVEHIQSGAVARVADLEEVTAFVRQCLEAAVPDKDEDHA